jgi:hypothetical protein
VKKVDEKKEKKADNKAKKVDTKKEEPKAAHAVVSVRL